MTNNVLLSGAVNKLRAEMLGGLNTITFLLAGERSVPWSGGDRDIAFYEPITFLGKAANVVARKIKEGSLVLVYGEFNYSTWENKITHAAQSRLSIKGYHLELLTSGDTSSDAKDNVRLKNALNTVELIGNLTHAAELGYTPKGTAVLNLPLAVNTSYINSDKKRVEDTAYFNVVVWQDLAEQVGSFVKGQRLFVRGTTDYESWQDERGSHYKTVVNAQRIEVLS